MQEDDELGLVVGDVVQVLSKDARDSGADGWWVGVRQPRSGSDGAQSPGDPAMSAPAQMGIFPCNYVIFLEACEASQVAEIDAAELEVGEVSSFSIIWVWIRHE